MSVLRSDLLALQTREEMNKNIWKFFNDLLFDSTKFYVLTNPLFYIFLIISMLFVGIIVVYEFIWNDKRWYYQEYDYLLLKKKVKNGLSDKQLVNMNSWIKRNPNHRRIKQIKEIYERNK